MNSLLEKLYNLSVNYINHSQTKQLSLNVKEPVSQRLLGSVGALCSLLLYCLFVLGFFAQMHGSMSLFGVSSSDQKSRFQSLGEIKLLQFIQTLIDHNGQSYPYILRGSVDEKFIWFWRARWTFVFSDLVVFIHNETLYVLYSHISTTFSTLTLRCSNCFSMVLVFSCWSFM